jgi:hypothetical protein
MRQIFALEVSPVRNWSESSMSSPRMNAFGDDFGGHCCDGRGRQVGGQCLQQIAPADDADTIGNALT